MSETEMLAIMMVNVMISVSKCVDNSFKASSFL